MIFVIDDSYDSFFISKRILLNINYKKPIHYISNKKDLFDRLNNCPPRNYPKLIFLDINMPKDNGYTILQELKKTSPISEIPVIILSTSTQKKDKQTSEKLKADGYIQKSIAIDEMSDNFRHFIQKYDK